MDFGAFGVWWDSQSWGTVADWFAAIGTVAAFGLGVWILFRDRTLRRQATANTFVTYPTPAESGSMNGPVGNHRVRVTGHNTGAAPIAVAIVEVKPPQGQLKYEWMSNASDTWEIASKTKALIEIQLGDIDRKDCRTVVVFTDERGQVWQRDLDSNKYLSKRGYAKFRKVAS